MATNSTPGPFSSAMSGMKNLSAAGQKAASGVSNALSGQSSEIADAASSVINKLKSNKIAKSALSPIASAFTKGAATMAPKMPTLGPIATAVNSKLNKGSAGKSSLSMLGQ